MINLNKLILHTCIDELHVYVYYGYIKTKRANKMIDMKEAHRLTRESVEVTKVSYRFALSLVMKQLWSELKEFAAKLSPIKGGVFLGNVVLKCGYIFHNVWVNKKVFAVGNKNYDELIAFHDISFFDEWLKLETRKGIVR